MGFRKIIAGIVLVFLILFVAGCSSSDSNNSDTTEVTMTQGEIETTPVESAQDETVVIKDSELEQMIRNNIGKPEGDITVSDMEMLYSLNIDYRENPVYEIDGLEYAINLGDFSYRYGALKALDPIAELKNITYLNISYSTVEDKPKNFHMPLLSRISFIETNLSDLDFLSELTEVTSANFTRSGVVSTAFLENWTKLEELNLSENEIEDISPLEGKVNLTDLTLHMNKVEDISALETVTSLERLNISYNEVSNIDPIMQLDSLEELTAYEDLDKKIIDRGLLQALEDKGVLVEFHE